MSAQASEAGDKFPEGDPLDERWRVGRRVRVEFEEEGEGGKPVKKWYPALITAYEEGAETPFTITFEGGDTEQVMWTRKTRNTQNTRNIRVLRVFISGHLCCLSPCTHTLTRTHTCKCIHACMYTYYMNVCVCLLVYSLLAQNTRTQIHTCTSGEAARRRHAGIARRAMRYL